MVRPADEVAFLRKLQRLLDEGDFVATYKFALLQALADLSVENEPAPDGTLSISLDEIAAKLIEYYWRQAVPYRSGTILRQSSGSQAAIVNRVAEAVPRYQASLAAARRDRRGWSRLCDRVARIVEQMPLWRLQSIAGGTDEFLYRRATFSSGSILLEPGIAGCFRSFHPFVSNLVRGAWLGQILRIAANRSLLGPDHDLSEFLFGTERGSLEIYREILRDHQAGECFYCGKAAARSGDVDHFIPWSRYPIDLGHNFVFTHSACNNRKRDYLAHPDHLGRWRTQNIACAAPLERQFDQAALPHDADRSLMIAKWAYEQGEAAGAHVWMEADSFEPLTGRWRAALGE